MVKELGAPEALLDVENVTKMLILLFPCTVSRHPMYTHLNKHVMVAIFKENNYRSRGEFFKDPLATFLWKKVFLGSHREVLIAHLRRMRSVAGVGEQMYKRFVEDLLL